MDITDNNEIDISYYDVDFFLGPRENFNYLINDANINIEQCYIFSFELIKSSYHSYLCRYLNLCVIKFQDD